MMAEHFEEIDRMRKIKRAKNICLITLNLFDDKGWQYRPTVKIAVAYELIRFPDKSASAYIPASDRWEVFSDDFAGFMFAQEETWRIADELIGRHLPEKGMQFVKLNEEVLPYALDFPNKYYKLHRKMAGLDNPKPILTENKQPKLSKGEAQTLLQRLGLNNNEEQGNERD